MRGLLRNPAFNAVCISVYSAFYGIVFIAAAVRLERGWQGWLAAALLAATAVLAVLLVRRKRPFDEYHTAILVDCLVVSLILTCVAIAAFFLMVLRDPAGIVEKFTLFIVIHWVTVVCADYVFVLKCRWK
ncbi:MAG: hypothetical protein LBR44_00160 [Clostridiales Family XIII bacterium]|jgi:hypothetical protein|nr:hypothetical protein [Clostridiales Family XIII bacterium]